MKYILSILLIAIGTLHTNAQNTSISFVPTISDCEDNPVPCSNSTICFAIELTTEADDIMSSYTLILNGSCSISNIVSNTSCVMVDNSFPPTACTPFNTIIFQSNGNAGSVDVDPNTPIRIHTICVELGTGETTVDFSALNLTVDYVGATGEPNPVIVGPTSFDVPMICDEILPVELTSFTARKKGRSEGLIEWVTASEVNTDYFEVERSVDGKSFDLLGTVKAKGNTYDLENYQLVDEFPFIGRNYYRLRIIDIDGTYTYSEIRSIDFKEENGRFTIFPNPVMDYVNITNKGIANFKNIEAQIFNNQGNHLSTTYLEESNRIDMNGLSPGSYVVHIVNAQGTKLMSQKVIKISN